jgi:hypothetical protein
MDADFIGLVGIGVGNKPKFLAAPAGLAERTRQGMAERTQENSSGDDKPRCGLAIEEPFIRIPLRLCKIEPSAGTADRLTKTAR